MLCKNCKAYLFLLLTYKISQERKYLRVAKGFITPQLKIDFINLLISNIDMVWFRKNKSGYKTFKQNGTTYSVHKRVAEKKVGGKIYDGYEVHHKDGNKNNNRPSNLAVLKKSFHRKIHRKKSFW